jgi:hypothetical protein
VVLLQHVRPFATGDAPATTTLEDAAQLDRISGV